MAVLRYFHQDPRQTSVQESSVIDKQGTVLTQKLTTINQSITNNTQILEDKQNSVPGKSLSTNDFTDEYKNKLRGIEEGAEVNVQSDWGEDDNTADSYIKNKPVIDDIVTQNSENLITSGAVFTAIDELPEPMIFKGSLGTGGTIQTLPAPSADNVGFVYKVITAGAYYGITAKPGDSFISDGSDWILIPSGDEPEGTVMSVGLTVPTGLQVSGSPITTSGTLAITYALGYAIPTTAKQDEWDAKQNAISDLSTIRTNASNGNTAYGWGNHANAGYLTGITKAMVTTALGYTPPQQDTNTTYSAGSGLSLSGTTFSLALTKALVTTALGYTPPTQDTNTWRGITDSYSGTDSSISLSQKGGKALYDALVNGYASSAGNADTVDSFHVDNSGSGPTWGRLTPVKSDGVLEVGKYIDFHNTSNDGKDYATRVQVTQHSGNSVNLPTTSGTLALTSQIPTNVSQLTNDSGYITSSPLGNYLLRNTAGGIASVSGGGQNWWFKIATIKIVNAYINRPIVFEISQRGFEFSILQVLFQNTNNTDPGLTSFTTNNVQAYYIRHTGAGTWEIYGKYSETWGFAVIHRITGCGADIGVTINMQNAGTTQPTDLELCTTSGNVHYASVASQVQWSGVINRPTDLNQFTNGPGYITGITKTMVTNALGYTPPTADTNTWRGITDSYSGTDSSISLSQKGGKALYDALVNGQAGTVYQTYTSTSNNYRVLLGYPDSNNGYKNVYKNNFFYANTQARKVYINGSLSFPNDGNSSGGWNVYDQSVGLRVLSSTGSSSTGAPSNYYATALHVAGQYWFQLAFERGDNSLKFRGGNAEGVNKSWTRLQEVSSSDIRLKDIQEEYAPTVEEIAEAPLFKFKWKEGEDKKIHVGTSAQYWQQHMPEVVIEEKDEMKTLCMKYDILGAVNSIAIAKEVVSLKEEIKLLQAQIAELKQLLNN